jgi:hypothetical protein
VNSCRRRQTVRSHVENRFRYLPSSDLIPSHYQKRQIMLPLSRRRAKARTILRFRSQYADGIYVSRLFCVARCGLSLGIRVVTNVPVDVWQPGNYYVIRLFFKIKKHLRNTTYCGQKTTRRDIHRDVHSPYHTCQRVTQAWHKNKHPIRFAECTIRQALFLFKSSPRCHCDLAN